MIKHFLKVFFASVIFISVILSATALGYIIFVDKEIVISTSNIVESQEDEKLLFYESSTYDYSTVIGRAAKNSKRFNVLLVGLENSRTDTIMVASYDMENKTADLISIPRDTYSPRNIDDIPELKKINSLYAKEGIEKLIVAVEELLGIPLGKYAIIDYNAVISCVDLIGGVEVDVPFNMVYSDPYDDPPLYINIPEGNQVLNGEDSLKFLRYRKGYANQDLGRIQAQQQFIKSAVKKSLGFKLPTLVKEAYSYIETNISLSDILNLAGDVVGFSTENINLKTMPGAETPLEGLSFYISDDEAIEQLVKEMYGLKDTEIQ